MHELPKCKIFRSGSEFNKVYNLGCSYVNRSLVIHVFKSDKTKAKVGFAVGKKIGNAVVRNRIKRLLRESYRTCQHDICPNVSLILVGRKSLIDAKSYTVMKAFKALCIKADILKKDDK